MVRLIFLVLMLLDLFFDEDGEGGLDFDVIREMLEDVFVMLGNANVRLNIWR